MGEYGREQRNKLSRVIVSSGYGSGQLKKNVDNREKTMKPISQLQKKDDDETVQRMAYIATRPLGQSADGTDENLHPKNIEKGSVGERLLHHTTMRQDNTAADREGVHRKCHEHIIFDNAHQEVSDRVKGGDNNDGMNIGFHCATKCSPLIGKGELFGEKWNMLGYTTRCVLNDETTAVNAVEAVQPEPIYTIGKHNCQEYCKKVETEYNRLLASNDSNTPIIE